MAMRIHSEKDKPVEVNYGAGEWTFYFQLVGIGPQTMAANNNLPWDLPNNVAGHFISGEKEEMKAFIHSLVDTAFKQLEESQNGKS
jgi:hypothetical protein